MELGVFEVPADLGEVSKKSFGSCPSHFGLSTKWHQAKTKLPSGSVFYRDFSLGLREKDTPEWNHFDEIPVSTATTIPNCYR